MEYKQEFIEIVKANEGIIYKITLVYADDPEDQKDLYQEIVYQLWKSFESFRSESKISTWIYRVALNTSIAQLNKRKRKVDHYPLELALHAQNPEADSLMESRIRRLRNEIKKLNVVEKGLILLYLEGKRHDEIAAITGFSVSNVGTRLGRIKGKLKSQITK